MTPKKPQPGTSLQADLTADLLSDLGRPAPLPSGPVVPAPLPSAPVSAGTPSVAVVLTPLRWALPSVGPVPAGVGLAVRVGPLQVSAALR